MDPEYKNFITVDTLDGYEQDVLYLFYGTSFRKMTIREIGQKFDISIEDTRRLLNAAKKKFCEENAKARRILETRIENGECFVLDSKKNTFNERISDYGVLSMLCSSLPKVVKYKSETLNHTWLFSIEKLEGVVGSLAFIMGFRSKYYPFDQPLESVKEYIDCDISIIKDCKYVYYKNKDPLSGEGYFIKSINMPLDYRIEKVMEVTGRRCVSIATLSNILDKDYKSIQDAIRRSYLGLHTGDSICYGYRDEFTKKLLELFDASDNQTISLSDFSSFLNKHDDIFERIEEDGTVSYRLAVGKQKDED